MIPPILFELGMKYGNKVLAGLLATSLVGGGYLFWEHKQEKEGRLAERKDWEAKEANINRAQDEFLKLKLHENEAKERENHNRYIGALKYYVEQTEINNRNLSDNLNKRLYVNTKCPSGRDSMSVSSEVPAANPRSSQAIDRAELGSEDTQAIFRTAHEATVMASACKQAIDFIEQNGMIE